MSRVCRTRVDDDDYEDDVEHGVDDTHVHKDEGKKKNMKYEEHTEKQYPIAALCVQFLCVYKYNKNRKRKNIPYSRDAFALRMMEYVCTCAQQQQQQRDQPT